MAAKRKYNTQCLACFEVYSADIPQVILPCKHDMCELCITRITMKAAIARCPICRTPFKEGQQTLQEYPEVKDREDKNKKESKKQGSSKDNRAYCNLHDFTFIYWCKTHEELICKQCMVSTHRYCEAIVTDGAFDIIKKSLCKQNDATLARSKEILEQVTANRDVCRKEGSVIEKLCQIVGTFRRYIRENEDTYTTMERKVKTDISNLESNSDKLKTLGTYTLGVVTSFKETMAKVESECWNPRPLTPVEGLLMNMARAVEVRGQCC